jgi:NAD(P)-dependent dehydrogenase (short-subunit alcohol dehydrogenase family)
VVVITGAGRGIGRAAAEAFAAAGYAVVMVDRAAGRGRRAERALRAAGATTLFVRADVSTPGGAERAIRAAVSRFGRLDCVVNNAGVLVLGPLRRLKPRDVEATVRVNLLGPLLVTRAALQVMLGRRPPGARRAIVNVSSVLGKEGAADYVAYCATKYGVIGLTEALADELRGTRTSVWAVCPGRVDTPMGHIGGVPRGEDLIPPQHVARVIVALATGRRRRPSGAAVDVDR